MRGALDRRDRALAVALFALSAASSTLLNDGVVCCNDGSHYALVRALGDQRTVIIDSVAGYTDYNDISQRDGHYYSDRPPGTALVALPFYLAARAAGLDDHGRQMACALVSLLAGAFAVALTFLLGRRLGLSRHAALAAALTLALCTLHRTYSSSLWNHALSAFLVVLAAWLATPRVPGSTEVGATDTPVSGGADAPVSGGADAPVSGAPDAPAGGTLLSGWRALLLGLVCGYMVVVDYSSAPVAAIVAGCVGWDAWRTRQSFSRLTAALAPLALGMALGVTPALVYHQLAFGSPFATPYRFHAEHHAVTRSVGSMYGGAFFEGLFGLLFSWRAGLLLYSPILVLGLFATPRWVRRIGWRPAASTVLPWVAMLLLTAKHATWHGGGAHDARYLMLVVPLFCLPVGAAFDSALALRDGRPRVGALSLFAVMFALSALIQFLKHPFGWMQNAAQWFPAFAKTLDTDPSPTVQRLLHLVFPHPIAAALVLALGAAAALLLSRKR